MVDPEPRPYSLQTRAVHRGRRAATSGQSVAGTVDPSNVWYLADLESLDRLYDGSDDGYFYASKAHPNTEDLAALIADLEGAEAGVVTCSGLSAFLAVMLATTRQGDHVIAADDAYGGTRELLARTVTRTGVDVDFVDARDAAAIERLVRPTTKWLAVETISNPLTRLVDVAALRRIADRHGFRILCDNTFATPMCHRPLTAGAHLVWHSVTKYLNGHHDVMAGVVVGDPETIGAVRSEATRCNLTLNAFGAWLATRGIRTLGARMERICLSAIAVASGLDSLDEHVEALHFPLLPGHPDYDLAHRLLPEGAGGMMSFVVRGDAARAERFVKALRLVRLATSLGGVQSTISHPARSSHRSLGEAERVRMGITQNMIRLSVGLESPRDILDDLRSALEKSAP